MRRATTEDVLSAACEAYHISPEDITKRSRKRHIVKPRQFVQYMCRRLDTDTMEEIARKTGVTNHATVYHSHKKVDGHITLYEDVAVDVTMIEEVLSERGFATKKVEKKQGFVDYYNPMLHIRGKNIPIKVTNKVTKEMFVANSICAAARLTDVNQRALTKECKKLGSAKSKYKFEYDV